MQTLLPTGLASCSGCIHTMLPSSPAGTHTASLYKNMRCRAVWWTQGWSRQTCGGTRPGWSGAPWSLCLCPQTVSKGMG